jgi:hypothetical protein
LAISAAAFGQQVFSSPTMNVICGNCFIAVVIGQSLQSFPQEPLHPVVGHPPAGQAPADVSFTSVAAVQVLQSLVQAVPSHFSDAGQVLQSLVQVVPAHFADAVQVFPLS